MTNPLIVTEVVITEENQRIIEAIKARNFILMDDHHGGRDNQCDGVAIHTNVSTGNQCVVPMHKRSENYPYYSINEIVLDEEGIPHLTRNAVSMMFKTSPFLVNDILEWRKGFMWDMIEKKPFMHPGHLTNLIEASAAY